MSKYVWGLDLGKWSLKAVKARAGKGNEPKVIVETVDVINYSELPCGLQAEDAEKFQESIRVFLENNEIGKSDRVMVGIPGQEVFSRFINLPPVPKKKIPEIVRYEAHQQIPFDIDSVVWDYQPIREEYEEGEEIEIGLFAFKQERVEDLLHNLHPLRMNLWGIQDAPLALFNFVNFEGYDNEALIVLDLGAQTTDLVVVDPPRFWLRPILVGGNNITSALQQKFNVSFEEAETVKFRATEAKHAKQIFDIMRAPVRNLTSEVQRSLGFYKSLFQETKFEKVVVAGNSFKLKGLERAIKENLLYDIQPLSEVRNIGLAPGVDAEKFQEDIVGLGVALGLCIQGLGLARVNVNLLPTRYTTEIQLLRKRAWIVACVVMLYLIVLSMFVAERSIAGQLADVKGEGVTVIDTNTKWDNDYNSAKQKLSSVESPIKGLATIGRRRDLWIQVLQAIVRDWKRFDTAFYVSRIDTSYRPPSELKGLGVEQRQPAGGPGKPPGGGPGAGAPAAPKPKGPVPPPLAAREYLCLDIVVETPELRAGVVKELCERLLELRLPEEKVPVFARVGQPKDQRIRRETMRLGDRENEYLVFTLRCVVKDDAEIEKEVSQLREKKEPEAPAGTTQPGTDAAAEPGG